MAIAFQVTFDCADPATLAEFWTKMLDYKVDDPPKGFADWPSALKAWGVPEADWNKASAIVDPDGKGPRVFFQRVPEEKVVKNRVHLDLRVSGDQTAAPDEKKKRVDEAVIRAESFGAKKLWPKEEMGLYWVVMQDPAGNEFCLS